MLELESTGIHLVLGDDFLEYRCLREKVTGRSPIYPMFDAQSSYVDHTNGFWICGFDTNGDLIHTQAVRLLELQGMTLGEHMMLHRHKYITPDSTPDPSATTFFGPRGLQTIEGRVAYHGDFWLQPKGLAGPRGNGTTAILSRMLVEVVSLAWAPNYLFALVPKKLAAKGAHLRYGYVHCEPGRWIGPDQQITDEDHLIWMSADDLSTLMDEATPNVGARNLPFFKRSGKTPTENTKMVEPIKASEV